MQAMTENPGMCFIQYPKVPINSCNSFFDRGTWICSSSFKVCGGATTLPASTKYPKILFLYLVLDIFQAEFQFLLHVMLPVLLLLLPPFHGNLLQFEYHLYIGTVSQLGGVRLSVKIQQD